MSHFYVKADRLNSNSAILERYSISLNNYADEIRGVDLSSLSDSIEERIRRTVMALGGSTEWGAQVMKSMALGLDGIFGLYRDTEYRLLGKETENGDLGDLVGGLLGELEASGVDTTVCWDTEGRRLLTNTSDEDMDALIEEFENEHPSVGEEFNRFLATDNNGLLSEDDIRNIKYLVYTAPEPYRSIFLSNLDSFLIHNIQEFTGADNGKAYFSTWLFNSGLTYDYPDSFGGDPRGPYTTFFHECGHSIDYYADQSNDWGYETGNYRYYSSGMGRNVTLWDTIEHDVYYNTNNPHSVVSIAKGIIDSGGAGSGGNVDHVIDALRINNTGELCGEDLLLYNAICNEQRSNIGSNPPFEAVSDVYGGVTHNAFRFGYGHDNSYWAFGPYKPAAKELWAEFFAYNMARDDEALANLREYFPESAALFDDYVNNYEWSYE
ncbi:MAG: hypothetical protein IJM34_12160 [Lachnospiraceae bacterium]|nr:hypothetical protein [Lachnospiraceae bacterium]